MPSDAISDFTASAAMRSISPVPIFVMVLHSMPRLPLRVAGNSREAARLAEQGTEHKEQTDRAPVLKMTGQTAVTLILI
jgi:hypothetical protein